MDGKAEIECVQLRKNGDNIKGMTVYVTSKINKWPANMHGDAK